MEKNYENIGLPAHTNRGVVNPKTDTIKSVKKLDNICTFDYFTCTLKIHTVLEVLNFFNFDLKTALRIDRGIYGYKRCYCFFSKCYIYYDNDKNHDILLWFSGRACREIYKYADWLDFCKFITKYDYIDDRTGEYIRNYNITRIDLAIDFYNHKYNLINKVISEVKKGNLVTLFRNNITIQKRNNENNLEGNSIRFGSMASDLSIIFYDKKLERANADYEVSEQVDNWYRLEVNYRRDSANILFQQILNDYDNLVNYHVGVIYNYLDFKKPSKTDSRRSRWRTAAWWSKIIKTSQKMKVAKVNINSCIMKKIDYVDNHLSKLFLEVFFSCGYHKMAATLENGVNKLKVSDLKIMQDYFKDNYNSEFVNNYQDISIYDLKDEIKKFVEGFKKVNSYDFFNK